MVNYTILITVVLQHSHSVYHVCVCFKYPPNTQAHTPSPCPGVEEFHEGLRGHIQELIKVHPAVSKLAESPPLFNRFLQGQKMKDKWSHITSPSKLSNAIPRTLTDMVFTLLLRLALNYHVGEGAGLRSVCVCSDPRAGETNAMQRKPQTARHFKRHLLTQQGGRTHVFKGKENRRRGRLGKLSVIFESLTDERAIQPPICGVCPA